MFKAFSRLLLIYHVLEPGSSTGKGTHTLRNVSLYVTAC